MRRTLGGDRIGSGEKMTVELSGWGRSSHSLTTDIATTMAIGPIYPIHHSLVLAGDTRELDLDALLMTHPTEGPLFDSAKLQIDVFSADIRLYIAKLHMNLLETGLDMSNIKFPLIKMEAAKIDWTKKPDNQQINPSSIFKYLHISGLGDTTTAALPIRYFNGTVWLMYWDVTKNYYANKQEKKCAVIHTGTQTTETIVSVRRWNEGSSVDIPEYEGDTEIYIYTSAQVVFEWQGVETPIETLMLGFDGTNGLQAITMFNNYTTEYIPGGGQHVFSNSTTVWAVKYWRYAAATDPISEMPRVRMFDLKLLDDMKMDILSDIKNEGAYIIDENSPEPFSLALTKYSGKYAKMSSQEGLALKTYQNDMFNAFLNTEYIDGANGINARTAIQTDAEGKFTIDNFLVKQKLYDHLNRVAVAGGTVADMMEVAYDTKNVSRAEIPVFEGGLSMELMFEQVISNAATADQPLGTIGGKGVSRGRKGGKVRITNDTTEQKYYIVMASLTPRLKYTQGNGWGTNLKTYEDLHKPAFDQIGFQDLITDWMASWDTKILPDGSLVFQSMGKQPGWTHYQTEINRAFGNFAEQNSEGWMIFDRNYEADPLTKRIKDLTTYIDPAKYNGVFAYAARDAMNVWAQFKIEDKAIRKMSANQMPRL